MTRSFFPRRREASAPAPDAVPSNGGAVHPRALAEIDAGRRRVRRRIESLQSLTEHEVLACGQVLSSIVDNVRSLILDTERTVSASLADSDATTARFIGEMQGDIQAQEAAVCHVLELADGMQEAIEAINGLSHYSNILSMNARIEAARIGHHGAGFAVIADHTRELSKTIREAAERVSKSIEAVRAGLPPVSERATSMQQRTRTFITDVSEQMKSASRQAAGGAGERGLEEVVRLSNEALSHLQFHDPVTQGLAGIGGDLDTIESRVRRVLGGETELEALPQETAPPAGVPAAGKITLF
jgi:methyl-accepting chemotaxis protein